jgi:putative redox protein
MESSGRHELRRSVRVEFPGSQGRLLGGILDQPVVAPRGFLLFSHCFTCNKDLKAIVRISRRLAERGWGVLRYDFAGLGNSQGDFEDTNFSTNRQDLAGAAVFLANHHQSPCLLIGHSFGGASSIAMAETLPSVRGVATIAAPSDTQHLAALLDRKNPDIQLRGEGHVQIGGRTYTIRRQMLDDFRAYDLERDLSQMTKPILIFHSPEDETLGYEQALRLFFLVSQRGPDHPASPGASLITLPRADHLLTRHPADTQFVADLISVWLSRLLAE